MPDTRVISVRGREPAEKLSALISGDVVYRCSPRMKEGEREFWSREKVQQVSASGLIMVGWIEYRPKDGLQSNGDHPFPARISLPTPAILEFVERFDLWCRARKAIGDRCDIHPLARLREMTEAVERLGSEPSHA